eukprot:5065647-Pyramimonas_sp.AAC.1
MLTDVSLTTSGLHDGLSPGYGYDQDAEARILEREPMGPQCAVRSALRAAAIGTGRARPTWNSSMAISPRVQARISPPF